MMGVFGGVPAMSKAMEIAGSVMDAPQAAAPKIDDPEEETE